MADGEAMMSVMSADAPEISFEKVGRQRFRVGVWRSALPADKRPILFFNGVGANLKIAQPLSDHLNDRDIISFDMPGIGGSPAPKLPYRPWCIASAAAKILDRYGYDQIDVLGVSWGGGIAQQFAFQYRARVHRLVLVATSAGAFMLPGELSALAKMAHPMRYTSRAYLIKHFEALYGDEPGGAEIFAARMKPPTAAGYIAQLAAMFGWTSAPFLPFITSETLIIAGDHDKIVPIANAHILKFLIRNAALHVVEGGGHLFMLSRADELSPILTAFLDAKNEPISAD